MFQLALIGANPLSVALARGSLIAYCHVWKSIAPVRVVRVL